MKAIMVQKIGILCTMMTIMSSKKGVPVTHSVLLKTFNSALIS